MQAGSTSLGPRKWGGGDLRHCLLLLLLLECAIHLRGKSLAWSSPSLVRFVFLCGPAASVLRNDESYFLSVEGLLAHIHQYKLQKISVRAV